MTEDDTEIDDDEWLSPQEAKALTKRSLRWLQLKADGNELTARVVGRGRQYLKSSVLALLESDSDTDATAEPGVWMLRETQKHAARSAELMMRGLSFVVDTCKQQQEQSTARETRLLARIAELEQKLDEQRIAAEEALSSQSERMVAEHAAMQHEERKNLLLKTGLAHLPRILGQAKVARLISSLDPEQMALVRALGTEEQLAFINEIREANGKSESKQGTGTESKPGTEPDRAGGSVCDATSAPRPERENSDGCEGPLGKTGGGVPSPGQSGNGVGDSRISTDRVGERHGAATLQGSDPVRGLGLEMCVCGHPRFDHQDGDGCVTGCACVVFSGRGREKDGET